jgi:hypothetical protein
LISSRIGPLSIKAVNGGEVIVRMPVSREFKLKYVGILDAAGRLVVKCVE